MLLGVIVMDCSIDGYTRRERNRRCQQIPIEFKDVVHTHTHTAFHSLFFFFLCPAPSSSYVGVSIDPRLLFIATSFNRKARRF